MDDQCQIDRVVAVVRRADPGLDEVVVRATVLAVATSPWARVQLARELSGQPGVLTSGRGGRYAVTQRLVVALAVAGSATVSRPHCTLCRRISDLPMALPGGGRACRACQDLLLGARCPVRTAVAGVA